MYERKDHFYKKAKKEGFVSRAAYKILEIQKKFKIWRQGSLILDLGCAPGGWLQILSKEVGPRGKVVGIDRLPLKIQPPPNVTFFQKNMEETQSLLTEKFDCIVSDLSPDLSGITFRDNYLSFELAMKVWNIAKQFLKENGNLVIKLFPGEETNLLKTELKKSFQQLNTYVPEATRKTSSEIYFVALKFKPGIH